MASGHRGSLFITLFLVILAVLLLAMAAGCGEPSAQQLGERMGEMERRGAELRPTLEAARSLAECDDVVEAAKERAASFDYTLLAADGRSELYRLYGDGLKFLDDLEDDLDKCAG